MTFDQLGLSAKVLKAVTASGYTTPTPIQEKAIPHVLEHRDVLGIAQTGTGKTASFVLPMLSLLEKGRARARMPRTLILEPTRELAAQVHENFEKYGQNHKLSVALLIGGVSFDEQNKILDRGADVLIATPGRLLDHFERGRLLMTGVEILVIDEADRMLDMGFIPDIEKIVGLVPFTRQTLFFSATMPPEIEKLSQKFLQNPVSVEVAKASSTSATIEQRAVACSTIDYEKRATLREILNNAENLKNAIIFCNRKRDISDLWKSLDRHGFSVGALHGDMDQSSRTATLEAFRDNKIKILVASDVAARGLDIPDVSHVVNYDVPFNAEDYVHRIGRTGRAGRKGASFTLVSPTEQSEFLAIEELIGQPIEWDGSSVDWDEKAGKKGRRGKGRDSGKQRSSAKSSDKGGSRTKDVSPSDSQAPKSRDKASDERKGRKASQQSKPDKARDNAKDQPKRPKAEAIEDGSHAFGSEEFVPDFLKR